MFGWFARLKLKSLLKRATAMHNYRQNNAVSDTVTKKELALLDEIAKLYEKYQFHKKFPHAREYALEANRAAASLNDIFGQYTVGKKLLEEGKFWDSLQTTMFACNAHKKYATAAYEEAFVYLNAAETAGHPLAKRLKGLAYVNGWGVEKDNDKGFSLVVDSIDQENAWDRATKIFEETGLNKPEFFSSIMSIRQAKAK
jgi:TPR repeat protein